jgi:hypothetical protein
VEGVIGVLHFYQGRALAQPLAHRTQVVEVGQVVARALKEKHRDLSVEKMRCAFGRWSLGRVKRKPQKH